MTLSQPGKPDASAPYRDPDRPVEERVADLLQRMTLEEKVAQLSRSVSEITQGGRLSPQLLQENHPDGVTKAGRLGLRRPPEASARLANEIQEYMVEQSRLGIPVFIIDEALHGLMAQGSTSFPQSIALASTWDVDLVHEIFTAAADEMRSRGGNLALTPVLGVAREPRWGRTEETYGEDAYLASRLGVAAVRGLQGDEIPLDDRHVLATAKHFAVHSQPEGGTNSAPANYSERTIRERFLPTFEAAVKEANVQAIMASYNEIDGIPVHVNSWMLQTVLRDEWGFDGMVTSDGYGVEELVRVHHVAADEAEAARKALTAGIDLELGSCFPNLVDEVREGRVSIEDLDRAVANILKAKFRAGLFENPYADPERAARVNGCADHQALALKAAHEAIVLLKNEDDLLPLRREEIDSIAVIGPNAAELHLGGYSVEPARQVPVLDGIEAKVGGEIDVRYAVGCRITSGKQNWEAWWEDGAEPSDPEKDRARIAEAVEVAKGSDVALLVVGGNETTCREAWAVNHPGDRDSLNLIGLQGELIRHVVETGTPTIVLLINGRPLSIPSVVERVPAILEGWYLGQETGVAVADVLFGDVNPSGKLPITIPLHVGQLPVYYNHKPSAKRSYLFSTTKPLFPFGFGLSYTTFEYENLRVEPGEIAPSGSATVRVDVTNTGSRAGDEIVQLYIRDEVCSVTRPVKELKGFERIALEPGETRIVEFTLGPDELSFLNAEMEREVEPGAFTVMVGRNSADYLSAPLKVR